MSALKPCPFCGSTDLRPFVDRKTGYSDSYGIQCNGGDCAVMGPQTDDAPSAIAAWNSRAGDDEVAKAHGYLTRNVLQDIHPECEPLPDLLGLCTQIDNMVTEIPRLRAELAAAREALNLFASATVLPTGAVIGLERSWFDAARTALGDTP